MRMTREFVLRVHYFRSAAKSRALGGFNETFYFLLCWLIASFESSSTTCQARSRYDHKHAARARSLCVLVLLSQFSSFEIFVVLIRDETEYISSGFTLYKRKREKRERERERDKKIRCMRVLRLQFEIPRNTRILTIRSNSSRVSNFLRCSPWSRRPIHFRRFDNSLLIRISNIPAISITSCYVFDETTFFKGGLRTPSKDHRSIRNNSFKNSSVTLQHPSPTH